MDAPSLTPEISEIINSVVSRVVKCVAVIKVYLFGSYYSGTYNKDSDIDIAFFIKSNETLIDAHRKIIKITSKYPVDIQLQRAPQRNFPAGGEQHPKPALTL